MAIPGSDEIVPWRAAPFVAHQGGEDNRRKQRVRAAGALLAASLLVVASVAVLLQGSSGPSELDSDEVTCFFHLIFFVALSLSLCLSILALPLCC